MFCCNCDGEVYQVNQSTTIGCFYTFPRPDWLRFSATPDWGPFEVLATTGLSKWQMKLEAALPIRVAICAILASNTPWSLSWALSLPQSEDCSIGEGALVRMATARPIRACSLFDSIFFSISFDFFSEALRMLRGVRSVLQVFL